MPQLFKIGAYTVYFWSNENDPLEPVHVHVAEGRASADSTKIWISSAGKALVADMASDIPKGKLSRILRVIEANTDEITEKWYSYFGEIRYFC